MDIEAYDVLVNKPSSAPYRAPGSPQVAFATETVVDEICKKLDMDLIDFRLLNVAEKGTRTALGPKYRKIGLKEVLGISAESVRPSVVDTDSIGHTDVTGGSRTTYATGYAAYKAAHMLIDEITSKAAKIWDISEDEVVYKLSLIHI